jgi:Ni2+-binding GTPase involved in maturation of urease and hydrogenase
MPTSIETSTVARAAGAKLEEAIRQASSQYFRLVLLAGKPGSGKTAVLQWVATKTACALGSERQSGVEQRECWN